MEGCSFEDQAGPAASFSGGSARISGSSFARNASGLSFFAGCRAEAGGCVLSGNGSPALQVHQGSRLLVSGCAVGGGPAALLLDGGAASLRGVRMDGMPFPGVLLRGRSELRAADVTYEGRPWRAPGGAAPSRPAGAGPAFRFVSATAGLPLFSFLYRLFYLAAPRAAGLLLRLSGLRSVYLYRGMAAPGWVPGLSDMDLACLFRRTGPEEDLALWNSLRRRLRLLRVLFPFTGEVMAAGEDEFTAFLSSWGVKGEEFSASSRLLLGEPAAAASPGAGLPAADRTEAFYAYTLLMKHFYSRGLPEPFVRRNCLKNLVDVKRYLSASSAGRTSRGAFALGQGLPLENFMSALPEDSAYGAFRALHEAAAAAARGTTDPAPGRVSAAGPWFDGKNFEGLCRGLVSRSVPGTGVVLDTLYRVYLVLPDEAGEDREAFDRACSALRSARADSPVFSASPLILTRRAFSMLAALPYLNDPCFAPGLEAAGRNPGLTPDDGGVCLFGLAHRAAGGPEGGYRASAALAARHFCASWRGLWTEMPPHYFYTRALGLGLLLERGEPLPFSSPEVLRAAAAAGGAAVPEWSEYCAGGGSGKNYRFIAERTARLGELCDAA